MESVRWGVVLVSVIGGLVVSGAWAADAPAVKSDESMASLGIDRDEAVRGPETYTVTTYSDGTTFPWVDTSAGTPIAGAQGDDEIGQLNWPFNIQIYATMYTPAEMIDVNSNGSLHFDQGGPRTLWVNCGDIPSDIDGQWLAPLGDDLNSNTVRYLVTGTAPTRILTIEWVDTVEFSGGGQADLQVSFYESNGGILVQVHIDTPFAFAADGVGGVNEGDLTDGQETYCGSGGGLPSADFDVLYELVIPVELQSLSVE